MTQFSNIRVPLDNTPPEQSVFLQELAKVSPETIGKLLADIPAGEYDKYYNDYTQATNLTQVPRARGADTYTPVQLRTTPVGFDAIVDAQLASGITERLFSMIENNYVNSTSDKVDNMAFFRGIENTLKSTEEGRYIWYSRFLTGAYDSYNSSGSILSAIANDTERYKYLKTMGTVQGASDTAASFIGGSLDPVPLIVGFGAGVGVSAGIAKTAIAGKIGSELLATELGMLAYGATREGVLQADDPTRTAGDSAEAIATDLIIGAALHGTVKGLLWGSGKAFGSFVTRATVEPKTKPNISEVDKITEQRVKISESINKAKETLVGVDGETQSVGISGDETVASIKQRIDAGEAVTIGEVDKVINSAETIPAEVTPASPVNKTILNENLAEATKTWNNLMDNLSSLAEKARKAGEPVNTTQVITRFTQKYVSKFTKAVDDLPTFISNMKEVLDELDNKTKGAEDLLASMNAEIDANNRNTNLSEVVDYMRSNVVRSPDATVPSITTTPEYAANRDYFSKHQSNFEGSIIVGSNAEEAVVGAGFEPGAKPDVLDWLARRATILKSEMTNSLLKVVERLTTETVAGIDKMVREQALIDLASIRDHVVFTAVKGQPSLVITKIVDTADGLRLVVEAGEPKFILDEASGTYLNKADLLKLQELMNDPSNPLALDDVEIEVANQSIQQVLSLPDVTPTGIAEIIAGPDLPTDVLNLGLMASDMKTGLISKMGRSVKSAISEGFESVIEGLINRSKILSDRPNLLRALGKTEVDAQGQKITIPISPETLSRRLSKLIVNSLGGVIGGGIAIGGAYFGSNYALSSVITNGRNTNTSSPISIENIIATEIVTDPSVFKSLYKAIYKLPPSLERAILIKNAEQNIGFGIDKDFIAQWNLQAINLLNKFTKESVARNLGIQPMTDQILQSSVIAYSSLQKPFNRALSLSQELSQEDKDIILSSIVLAEQAVLSSDIDDPREAMDLFGKAVASNTDSRFWDITFPEVNAYFKSMNKQSVEGINGLGSKNVSMINVAAVSALYQNVLNSKEGQVGNGFMYNAFRGSTMRNLFNDSIISRIDKMTSRTSYDLPLYTPEDGQSLLSFAGLQSELSRGMNNDRVKAAVTSLPVADLLALRKVRNSIESNRAKVSAEDYKQFDTIRNRTNMQKQKSVLNKKNDNTTEGSLLIRTKTQEAPSILQEKP